MDAFGDSLRRLSHSDGDRAVVAGLRARMRGCALRIGELPASPSEARMHLLDEGAAGPVVEGPANG